MNVRLLFTQNGMIKYASANDYKTRDPFFKFPQSLTAPFLLFCMKLRSVLLHLGLSLLPLHHVRPDQHYHSNTARKSNRYPQDHIHGCRFR